MVVSCTIEKEMSEINLALNDVRQNGHGNDG